MAADKKFQFSKSFDKQDMLAFIKFRQQVADDEDYNNKISDNKEKAAAVKEKLKPFENKLYALFHSEEKRKLERELAGLHNEEIWLNNLIGNATCSSNELFIDLPVGAKQYGACIEILKLATKDDAPQEEFDFVVNAVCNNIEQNPLCFASLNSCIAGAKCWSYMMQEAKKDAFEKKYSWLPQNTQKEHKHSSLTKFMKQKFSDLDEIIDIAKKCDVNTFVGTLPPEWLALLPKENLKEKINEIDNALSKFAYVSYSVDSINKSSLNGATDFLQKELGKILQTDIKVEYYSRGAIGKIFKITTGDKKLALKTNHSNPSMNPRHGLHGVQTELIHGLFLSNNGNKKRYAKTYFGNLKFDDVKSAFMITRFIKENPRISSRPEIPPYEKIADQIRYSDDHRWNFVSQKIVDFGGVQVRDELKNRDDYLLLKKICKALKSPNGGKLIENMQNYAKKDRKFASRFEKIKNYIAKNIDLNDTESVRKDYGFLPENTDLLNIKEKQDKTMIINRQKDTCR